MLPARGLGLFGVRQHQRPPDSAGWIVLAIAILVIAQQTLRSRPHPLELWSIEDGN